MRCSRRVVGDRERTRVFAHYASSARSSAAVGALAAGVPRRSPRAPACPLVAALQAMFVLYALLGVGGGARLSRPAAGDRADGRRRPRRSR